MMEILRHTQINRTRRYVKGQSPLPQEAVRRVGNAFLLPPLAVAPETPTETTERRKQRACLRRRSQ
jgi:hypothetical protein